MRKAIVILSLVLIASFLSAASAPQEKMRIAVMDLQANGVSETTAKTVSDLLRTELFNTGGVIVIERAEMEKIMKEQGFQQTGITEIETAVKFGKLSSAKKVLVGTVNKLADSFIINARIIDVESGVMDYAENTKVASEAELDQGCRTFAIKLANRINGTTEKVAKSEKNKDTGKTVLGCAIMIGGAAAIVYLVMMLLPKK